MDVKSRWNGMHSPTSWELCMNILALPSALPTVTMLCDLSILRLTFTASPAHLKLPLTMETYSSVMAVAAGILVWTPLVVFLSIPLHSSMSHHDSYAFTNWDWMIQKKKK